MAKFWDRFTSKKQDDAQHVPRSQINDSLYNIMTGIGSTADPRSYAKFTPTRTMSVSLDRMQLNDMYRTISLAGKIVDQTADEMTKAWRTILNKEALADAVQEEELRLNLQDKINECLKWSRLYGGCALVLDIAGTGSAEEPLDLDDVMPNSLRNLYVIDKFRAPMTGTIELDPMTPRFGLPDYYMFQGTTTRVHYTRVIRFEGLRLPWWEMVKNWYWGDSVLTRCYDPLINYHTLINTCVLMAQSANEDVLKSPQVFPKIVSGDIEFARNRFAVLQMTKSVLNAKIIDGAEELTRLVQTFTGLPELIDRLKVNICATTEYPQSILFGESEKGLSATGEGDTRNYRESCESRQKTDLDPAFRILDLVLERSLNLPEPIEYEWNPLVTTDEKDKADTAFKWAQVDSQYINDGVITQSIAAKRLAEQKVYSGIDQKYINDLEKMEREQNQIENANELERNEEDVQPD